MAKPSDTKHMKLRESISQLATRLGMSSVDDLQYEEIISVVNEWTSDPAAESAIPVPDRVLARAISEGLIAEAAVPASGNWRDLAESLSSMAGPLYRMAAGVYGYRPVLICEMSSIVQADLLSVRLSPQDWQNLFENGLVPVVEHGTTPEPDVRVLIATQDPSNRMVRQIVDSLRSIRPDVVFAEQSVVAAIQEDIAQCVPVVGSIVNVHRPKLKKLAPDVDTQLGRAA